MIAAEVLILEYGRLKLFEPSTIFAISHVNSHGKEFHDSAST